MLPEKKYFKIGEVADLVGVEPHVLRYWETQFPQLRPHKARSGHRLYRRREVETLLVIRELLHVQRFTIAGARQALRQPGGALSLLPRFFNGPHEPSSSAASDPSAPSIPPIVEATAPTTLVPHDATDATDPDGAPTGLFDDDGHELVSLEAEGLDGAALREALERQAAERSSAPMVEVDVEGVDVPPARAPRPRVPVVSLSLTPRKRSLLEDALGDARAILAVLDREDARAHA